MCSVSLLHCAVVWFVFCVLDTLCCEIFVFCVPSTLFCGLVGVFLLCPFYTVMWVSLCLRSVSFLHCVVGWSVFVFCVPSTL